jgi:hypothetical protein
MFDRAQIDLAQHPITPKQFARSQLSERRRNWRKTDRLCDRVAVDIETPLIQT